jgi:ATP-binding cassette subfamily B protein AbcA/BmrA
MTATRNGLGSVLAAGKPSYLLIAIGCAISVIEVFSTLYFPVLAKNIVDGISTRLSSTQSLFQQGDVLTLIIILLLASLASAASNLILSQAGIQISTAIRRRVFEGVIGRDISFFDARDSGELASRITNDTKPVSALVTKSLSGLINGVLLLVGSIVVLSLLDLKLTGAIFSAIFLAFLVMAPSFIVISRATKGINDSNARFLGSLSRVFREIRLVKAYGAAREERRRIDDDLSDMAHHTRRASYAESLLNPINGFALSACMLIIIGHGGYRVQTGEMSVGTLTAFILYIFNIVAPLIQISTFLSSYQSARASSVALVDLLNGAPAADEVPAELSHRPDILEKAQDIRFDGVQFSYGRGAEDDITLQLDALVFPAGSKTIIAGPSGSGKTTLFSLLERFYEPQHGVITYGGTPIRDIDLEQWRGIIGYVQQSAPMMTGTIRSNICYGVNDAVDEKRMIAAAVASNAIEFINALKDGFDSPVGEAGVALSGGQRQRIALARMFYRDPLILLLDEASASLDEGNEWLLGESLKKLEAGRTTIVITHRPSAFSDADRIIEIASGRLVSEVG